MAEGDEGKINQERKGREEIDLVQVRKRKSSISNILKHNSVIKIVNMYKMEWRAAWEVEKNLTQLRRKER